MKNKITLALIAITIAGASAFGQNSRPAPYNPYLDPGYYNNPYYVNPNAVGSPTLQPGYYNNPHYSNAAYVPVYNPRTGITTYVPVNR